MAALLVLAASCSGKFGVGHEVDSSLYLLNYGRCEIAVSPDNVEHSLYICKGGLNDDAFAVSLSVEAEDLVACNAKYMSAYKMLPPNSYEFDRMNMLVGKEDVKTAVRITFRYDCLPKGTFVLPVRLRCTSDRSVRVDEEYSTAWLFVTRE